MPECLGLSPYPALQATHWLSRLSALLPAQTPPSLSNVSNITCSGNDNNRDNLSGNSSDFEIDVEDFPPGDYNLTVAVRDGEGNTDTEVLESLPLSGLSQIPSASVLHASCSGGFRTHAACHKLHPRS